ncbi:Class III cytochrome C family protein [Humidesulfovibrio mexicanus]|uniref:Class III cytochrome C family protein n=1 Tax=Humidesulfovibrio mexicanus TaxID=147047 RepID=A0A238XN86_9BACT|nr:cytochrome c3 family protein [Humidesulfovibrio mexicanus]SNR59824.1 Class III cytochrome C family protein [Humidesulfovibrio mexicanus]
MPGFSRYKKIITSVFCLLFALGVAATSPAQQQEAADAASAEQASPSQQPGALPDGLAAQDAAPSATVESMRFRHDEHNAKAKLQKRCAACHHSLERGRRSVKRAGPLRRCTDCHLARPEANSPLPSQMLVSHATCQGCHKAKKKGPLDCAGCHGS